MHAKVYDRTVQPGCLQIFGEILRRMAFKNLFFCSFVTDRDRVQLTAVYCNRRGVQRQHLKKDPFSQCEQLQETHMQVKKWIRGNTDDDWINDTNAQHNNMSNVDANLKYVNTHEYTNWRLVSAFFDCSSCLLRVVLVWFLARHTCGSRLKTRVRASFIMSHAHVEWPSLRPLHPLQISFSSSSLALQHFLLLFTFPEVKKKTAMRTAAKESGPQNYKFSSTGYEHNDHFITEAYVEFNQESVTQQRFPEDLDYDDAVIGQTIFKRYRRRVDRSEGEGSSSGLSSSSMSHDRLGQPVVRTENPLSQGSRVSPFVPIVIKTDVPLDNDDRAHKVLLQKYGERIESYHNKTNWANFVSMQDFSMLLKSDSISWRKILQNFHNSVQRLVGNTLCQETKKHLSQKVGSEGTPRWDPYWKLQPVACKVKMEIRIMSLNKDNSHSWVRISHGLNKLVTNLNNKEYDDNEQEISEMQFEDFASQSKAKAKPSETRFCQLIHKNYSHWGKNLDWCWTTKIFAHRLSSVEETDQSSSSWKCTSRQWWTDWILVNKRLLSGLVVFIGVTKKWKRSMAGGGGHKKRFQYCPHSSGTILYLRALQGHSGRNLIDPSLQDNVVIPDCFFKYIYHVGCAINLHSIINSGLIPGGQNLINRLSACGSYGQKPKYLDTKGSWCDRLECNASCTIPAMKDGRDIRTQYIGSI